MSFLPALTRRMCAWPPMRNSLLMIAISRQVSVTNGLKHDPEKHALGPRPDGWVPVFPRDKREAFARRSCSNKKIERNDDSKKSHPALVESKLAVLDAVGLVTSTAFLADGGERRLQRIEILDLGFGLRHHLAEARDMRLEAGLVFPDFCRPAVITVGLLTFEAGRKQGRKLLDGVLKLGQCRIDGSLIVGLLPLDYRSQSARVLAVALHHGLGLFDQILLRCHHANPKQERSYYNDSSKHRAVLPFPKCFQVPPRMRRSRLAASHVDTAGGISFRTTVLNIRGYVAADARGSRSRPVPQSPACRCGRFCIRATALR